MTFKKKYAPLSSAKTFVRDRLVMAAAGRVRPSAGPAGRCERQLSGEAIEAGGPAVDPELPLMATN